MLLENSNDICNHHRNIQALLIEVLKMQNGLAPPIMKSILNKRFNAYNIRNFQTFVTERKRTPWCCLENLGYRYPQLWSLLLESLKKNELFKPIQKKY